LGVEEFMGREKGEGRHYLVVECQVGGSCFFLGWGGRNYVLHRWFWTCDIIDCTPWLLRSTTEKPIPSHESLVKGLEAFPARPLKVKGLVSRRVHASSDFTDSAQLWWLSSVGDVMTIRGSSVTQWGIVPDGSLWSFISVSPLAVQFLKHSPVAACQWLMPAILATWEAEIGRIMV
jgi:hypothetical protein